MSNAALAAPSNGLPRRARRRCGSAATVDGDGQMDPRRLDRFLDLLVDGDADYAKGTRLSRREHTAGMPAFRLFEIGY